MTFAAVPFEPRRITFDGVRPVADWHIKIYSVLYEDRPLDEAAFVEGESLVLAALPRPAETPLRPGVGFLIRHQGEGANYAVLTWFDNRNEMPQRIAVDIGEGWRDRLETESFCVWDAEIIWHERNAFIRRLLSMHADRDAYLRDVFDPTNLSIA